MFLPFLGTCCAGAWYGSKLGACKWRYEQHFAIQGIWPHLLVCVISFCEEFLCLQLSHLLQKDLICYFLQVLLCLNKERLLSVLVLLNSSSAFFASLENARSGTKFWWIGLRGMGLIVLKIQDLLNRILPLYQEFQRQSPFIPPPKPKKKKYLSKTSLLSGK